MLKVYRIVKMFTVGGYHLLALDENRPSFAGDFGDDPVVAPGRLHQALMIHERHVIERRSGRLRLLFARLLPVYLCMEEWLNSLKTCASSEA